LIETKSKHISMTHAESNGKKIKIDDYINLPF